MGKWRLHQPSKSNFFVLEIVRICQKATEPLTNFFVWLYKGTPVRYIDGDERQPSRLAILVWSEADEVAAELEELDDVSGVGGRVGIYGREGRPDAFLMARSSEALHGAS